MLNLTNTQIDEAVSRGDFTVSEGITMKLNMDKVQKAPRGSVAVGYTSTLEEAVQTVLSKNSKICDNKCIELLKKEVNFNFTGMTDKSIRTAVSFMLLKMFQDGKATRVKSEKVFIYSAV